jgi:hypothetical protein
VEDLMNVSQLAGVITILLLATYGLLNLIFGFLDSIRDQPWGPEAPDHKDPKGGSRG